MRWRVTLASMLFGWGVAAGAADGAFTARDVFSARDLDSGAPVSIRLREARLGTVIVFLSAECPCSAAHEEALRALSLTYAPKGFRFVALHANQNESIASARAYFGKAKLPFPVLQDTNAEIADRLGALKTPHAFVFDAGGEMVFQGGVDDSHDAKRAHVQYLKKALQALESGQKPEPARARALGCVIQRG